MGERGQYGWEGGGGCGIGLAGFVAGVDGDGGVGGFELVGYVGREGGFRVSKWQCQDLGIAIA